ncbi:MAG: protein kinase, partial [Planctomycetes bacterium]|nr:protein kinase [Planctomycetota bacterium]
KLLRPHRKTADAASDDESIVQEGRNMARVHHPNSVVVHGAAHHGGRIGLWMEFVHGQTLEAILRHRGAFGSREAAVVGLDVLRALAAVHGAGIIHRDVKAQNVMREEGGRIVLMDFGAGSAVHPEGSGSDYAGTPLYMAPELLSGAEASVRSDIYGVGVLLYHLVTNEYPHEGSTMTELIRAHTRTAAGALRDARPDLPRAFVEVVEKALAPDPPDRFTSAGEMERALAETLRPRRSLWTYGLAGAIGAAVLIAAGVTLQAILSPAYTVQATMCSVKNDDRTPLASGARIHVDDELAVEFAASRPVWVYVINEDANGEQIVLFPLKGYDLQNPIPPRADPYVLPGAYKGDQKYWTVTSAGERERFLIEASPEPDTKLEQRIALVRTAADGQPVRLPPITRGVSSVRSGPETRRAEPESLIDAIDVLTSKPETATGVWKRIIELANPSH